MIAILADQNFDHRILRGLKRALPDLPIITARQLGLEGASDDELLHFAALNDLIIVTHDIQTFPPAAYERVRQGEKMSGVIVVPDRMPIANAMRELVIIIVCKFENEWENEVSYLPI
jgi:hypothetical protein